MELTRSHIAPKLSRIEALADALHFYNGANRPIDPAYFARNPLRLQVFTGNGQATGKLRHFSSHHSGFQAALFDLRIKCSGKSRAKLDNGNFTLTGLVESYNLNAITAKPVARFLRQALGDDSITENTPLDYFLKD